MNIYINCKWLIIFICIISQVALSQCPELGYLVFTSNQEIEEFKTNYPNCTSLDTLLFSNPDIVDLDFVGNIDSIGTLSFSNVGVKNFDFLANVSIINNLIISNNDSLSSEMVIPYAGSLDLLIIDSNSSLSYTCRATSIKNVLMRSDHLEDVELKLEGEILSLENIELKGNVELVGEAPIYIRDQVFLIGNNYYKSYNEIFVDLRFDNLIWHGVSDVDSFSLDGIEQIESSFVYGLHNIGYLNVENVNESNLMTYLLEIKNIKNGLTDLKLFSNIGALIIILDSIEVLESLDHLDMTEVRELVLTNMNDLHDINQSEEIQNSLGQLSIFNNPLLDDCSVSTICSYLESDYDENDVEIYGNLGSCDSAENILAACALSTNEIVDRWALSISPNPAIDFATVSFDLDMGQSLSIQVIDMMGRVVSTLSAQSYAAGTQSQVINTSDFQNGAYVVIVSGAKGALAKTMLIKK